MVVVRIVRALCSIGSIKPTPLWVGLVMLAVFSGCGGPKFTLKRAEPLASAHAMPVSVTSEDSLLTCEGIRLDLPGYPVQAAFDDSTGMILVSYTQDSTGKNRYKKMQYLLHDTRQDRTEWCGKGNPIIANLYGNTGLLAYAWKTHLFDFSRDSVITDLPNLVWSYRDGMILDLTKDNYRRLDHRDGTTLWKKPGSKNKGYRRVVRSGDWAYVTAEDFKAVDTRNGEGWEYLASTSHEATGKAVAQGIFMGLLSAFSGSNYYGSGPHADVTHNVCSQPLVVGDRVYYAARKSIYCFEKATGTVVWSVELPKELGSMQFYNAGPYVALVGLGWKYVDFVRREAEPPTVVFISQADGTIASQVEIPEVKIALDFAWLGEESLLLTPNRLIRFGKDLVIKEALDVTDDQGRFLRFLPDSAALIVRSSTGITCYDRSAFDQLWQARLAGHDSVTTSGPAAKPGFAADLIAVGLKEIDEDNSFRKDSLMLFTIPDGQITGIDLSNKGRLAFEVRLGATSAAVRDDGVAYLFAGKSVTVLPLNKISSTGSVTGLQ